MEMLEEREKKQVGQKTLIEELMSKNDPIVEAIISLLQSDSLLKVLVDEWERVNGVLAKEGCTIGVGWENDRFNEYDRNRDEAEHVYKIFLKRDDKDIARGEKINWVLGHHIRNVLSEDYTLGGTVPVSFVRSIEALYSENTEQMHLTEITLEVKTYAKR
jgi:hypothetical protein